MPNSKKFIEDIEKKRKTKVIVYFTGDRVLASAQIGEDAVRLIYDHLLDIGETKRIDMFLYSRGGDVSVPWRIVSMIREFCDEFNVIIPFRAHSAATLISLGSDSIIMNKKAELSPVDPTLTRSGGTIEQLPLEISVEDVKSYLNFLRIRAGITDQLAISQNVAILSEKLTPLIIGQIDRMDHHIRLVSRRLLTSRNEKMDESKINSIVEVLTEKIYSHGHAIARSEAKDLGLPVIFPDKELEGFIWNFYLYYEKLLELLSPIYPEEVVGAEESKKMEKIPIAIIESLNKKHIFKQNLEFKKVRNVPPNPQINVSLNLNLPPETMEHLEENQKRIMQGLIEEINKVIPNIVYENIMIQSPIIDIRFRPYSGKWEEE